MTDNNKNTVFVYGTLRGRDKAGTITPATHVLWGYALYNYYNKFPYIEHTGGTKDYVLGNIIEVDDAELAQLDQYEGLANNLYSRERVHVEEAGGFGDTTTEVWVYVADEISLRILSGDWADV